MEKVTYLLPVRTFEVDRNGHVPNREYMDWMELGWTKLLTAIRFPGYGKEGKHRISELVVSLRMRHRRPLRLGETVNAEAWVSKVTAISVRMEFQFFNQDGNLAASGRQEALFIEEGKKSPLKLTAEHKAIFEPYLDISEEDAEKRKHERAPATNTNESVGKLVIDDQEHAVIIYDESVGGLGVVAIGKLPAQEGQTVTVRRDQKAIKARIAYMREFDEGGMIAYRLGLEILEPLEYTL